MFGYVMPLKDELRIREYNTFRSYYCGLCNEIGDKSYVSKLTLTYDMTFLALLLSSIYNDRTPPVNRFCPFKMAKVTVIPKNKFLEYAAEMNIILSNRKLLDNYNDDKSYLSLMASKIVNTNKLSEWSLEKLSKIDSNLKKLNELEKEKCSNIDEIAHYFAEITAEIFCIDSGATGKILRNLGYNLGKWIYTLDAYDDLAKDIEKKRYNPLLHRFDYKEESAESFKSSIKDNVKFTLIKCLDEISKSFELLEIKKNKEIIENIIYLGMERKTMNVIEGSCCNEESLRGFRGKGGCIPGRNKAGI
jgi:hypothetical protein